MWNILFVGTLLTALCYGDVSHLKDQHPGYPTHKPDHPLELPGEATSGYPSHVPDNPLQLPEGTSNGGSVAGYPRVVPENPLPLPEASSGNVRNQLPDSQIQGSSSGGVIASRQKTITEDHSHEHDHHYHGEDGKYNPHDDGRGWDIRKSIPGEPGDDYPTYDSVPSTSFTCREKAPGYYADEEARCQVFRVCTTNSLKTYNSFLCPNGSLFNQRVLTCDWWMNVDCESSSEYYYKNQEIGKMPEGHKLMIEIKKMLEAPARNPFYSADQGKQFVDQAIVDNQIQGTGPVQDVYLPAVVVTTEKKIYTPTVPPTTTTTTFRPIITNKLEKVDMKKLDINLQSLQNVKVKEVAATQPVDQFNLSNVKQNTPPPFQVGAETEENLHVSQVLKTSPELHVSPKFQPTLHLSKQNPVINNPQPLLVSQEKKLFTSGENSISQAQKQPQGNLFESPMLASNKTDSQLFASQLTQTNNAQPLFVSKSAVGQNKTSDGQLFTSQLTETNNAQPLFVSKSAVGQNKISQLTETNNVQPLFVSKSSVEQNKTADGQLFTSKLTETNNVQPLFVSKSSVEQNKTSDGQLFTSKLTETNNAQPLFVSKSTVEQNKTSDGQLFTSKLTETNNAQPLFVSKSTVEQNKTSDGQFFTSKLTETNNAQPLFVSKSTVEQNKSSDGQLFTSQLTETNNAQPSIVSQSSIKENNTSDGQMLTSQLTQTNNVQPLSMEQNKTSDGQLFTSQLTETNNVQPLFVSRSKDNKLFTSPERPIVMVVSNNKTLFTSPRLPSSNVSKPSVEKDQLFLSQIDQSGESGLTGYNYQKPSLSTQQVKFQQVTTQSNNPQIPSVTVTKEKTHTVINSEKTTHVFQNVEEGPQKVSLIGAPNVVSTAQSTPNINTAGINQANLGGIQQTIGQVVPQPGIDQTSFSGVQQGVIRTQQQHSGIDQASLAGIQQTVAQGVQQSGLDQSIFTGIQQGVVQSQLQPKQVQPQISLGDLTKDQAFLQIDKIQSGLQQITQQQDQISKFGQGVLNPRDSEQIIPVPNFGQNTFQSSQGFVQNIQPNILPTGSFVQDYHYQQPNFYEQNLHNFNYQGRNAGQNFNLEVSRDGSAQNFRGESLSQISNGQSHSTFTGHNLAFKQHTKVDVVPSLGFHLNDEFEKDSYISAVLSGLVNDEPSYAVSATGNIGQRQFLPADARYSSYHGPSSYLAPQASVPRLPSDSGYYR